MRAGPGKVIPRRTRNIPLACVRRLIMEAGSTETHDILHTLMMDNVGTENEARRIGKTTTPTNAVFLNS